jgi:multiple sugar transport system substrate-binding protein
LPDVGAVARADVKASGCERRTDVTSLLINVKEKTTFLFPITDHASQIEGIMHPAIDDVFPGKAPSHR